MWGFDFEFESWWNVLPLTLVHFSCGSQKLISLLLWLKIYKLLHHLSGSSLLALSSLHNIQSSFTFIKHFSLSLLVSNKANPQSPRHKQCKWTHNLLTVMQWIVERLMHSWMTIQFSSLTIVQLPRVTTFGPPSGCLYWQPLFLCLPLWQTTVAKQSWVKK